MLLDIFAHPRYIDLDVNTCILEYMTSTYTRKLENLLEDILAIQRCGKLSSSSTMAETSNYQSEGPT